MVYKSIDCYKSPIPQIFPSRLVMFKIMRACIEITDSEDLWYNHLQKKSKVKFQGLNAKQKRLLMKKTGTISDKDMENH